MRSPYLGVSVANRRLATDPSTRPAASLRITPKSGALIQYMDILLLAHLLQHLWPHRDADFAEVRFAQQQHQRSRLPDAAADAERNLVVDDRLVIRELQKVQLSGQLQLLLERFGVHAD